jgi:hypothetical protein
VSGRRHAAPVYESVLLLHHGTCTLLATMEGSAWPARAGDRCGTSGRGRGRAQRGRGNGNGHRPSCSNSTGTVTGRGAPPPVCTDPRQTLASPHDPCRQQPNSQTANGQRPTANGQRPNRPLPAPNARVATRVLPLLPLLPSAPVPPGTRVPRPSDDCSRAARVLPDYLGLVSCCGTPPYPVLGVDSSAAEPDDPNRPRQQTRPCTGCSR